MPGRLPHRFASVMGSLLRGLDQNKAAATRRQRPRKEEVDERGSGGLRQDGRELDLVGVVAFHLLQAGPAAELAVEFVDQQVD